MARFPGSTSDLEAAALLGEKVSEALRIAENAHEALRAQISAFEEVDSDPDWARVQGVLATRVADDIRAAAGLVLRGYFAQAMTLGASVYELAYMAAFIGADNDRAREWLTWTTLRKLPWTVPEMVKTVRTGVFGADSPARERDGRYTALCWAKHGNPKLLKSLGVASTPEAHVLNVDPNLGNNAHRLGELAIWTMIEPVIVYLSSLHLKGHLAEGTARNVTNLMDLWKDFDHRIWPREE